MKKKQKTVVFTPDWRKDNPYQSLLADGVERHGWNVEFSRFPKGYFAFSKLVSRHKPDVIHLHWIKGLVGPIFWTRSRLIAHVKVLVVALDVLLCRMRGVRVVWTIHNKFSHECSDVDLELKLRRLLAQVCSAVIVHSEPAKELLISEYKSDALKKACVIPHGNYEGFYPEPKNVESLRARLGIESGETVFLFFGAIRPYKGVEKLIAAFNRADRTDAKLLIFGKPNTAEYQKKLEALVQGRKRIVTGLAFVEDSLLLSLIELSDAVVIPFSQTLTSGSAILSMSRGRALVLPDSARVFGCVPNEGAFYFMDEGELQTCVQDTTKESLRFMGTCNQIAVKECTFFDVANKTCTIYAQQ